MSGGVDSWLLLEVRVIASAMVHPMLAAPRNPPSQGLLEAWGLEWGELLGLHKHTCGDAWIAD